MYGMYMLRMEEMKLNVGRRRVQEKLLYHVTTESRAMESLNSGLDWRRTRRNKFGCGVSFSDDADYANYYADNSPSEDTRVIMMCLVLEKKTYVVPRRYLGSTLVIPPDQADTTMSHNKRVIVKYNDNEFYPLYFVYYQRRPEYRTTSKYNHANSRRLQLEDAIDAMNIYDDPYGGEPSYFSDLYEELQSQYDDY
uniref:Poly [ADP-ribose] polymerase n=1 Tax=Schizaphis graminum TaxID=13262 RepID=A0A2S2PH98_SCHGA